MRFLADMGVSLTTVRALREDGHDATHLREEGLSRLADIDILEKARIEQRVILTFDLLATGEQSLPSVIIFRLRNETPRAVTIHLKQLIAQRTADIDKGAIVIVEDARHRLRRLPLEP